MTHSGAYFDRNLVVFCFCAHGGGGGGGRWLRPSSGSTIVYAIGDNCKKGPPSQVGPGPPTCLIRPWSGILVQVTIYRRLLIGRDGHLDQSEAYDIS